MNVARDAFVLSILFIAASFFCGCSEEPTPFSVGQEIPMGSYRLTVSEFSRGTIGQYIPHEITQTEFSAKLAKLLGPMGRDSPAFVVFFSFIRETNEGSLLTLATLNNKMFYLANRDGEKIYPLAVFPKRLLYMGEGWILDYNDVREASEDLQKPKDFFALFSPGKGTSGYTLFVKNPSQQKGQTALASFPLGS